MTTVRVELGPRSYEIRVVDGGGSVDFGRFARESLDQTWAGGGCQAGLVVTDSNLAGLAESYVEGLAGVGIKAGLAVVPAGEGSKSLDRASELFDRLVAMKADRHTCVVAVGGGVVGDLAGFAAATYARGLPMVMVPTSLLAQVDSSVGGKVGVNHPNAKNIIGAFHQPTAVWIDLKTLETLPVRELKCGLAEVVKYGVILDPDFFDALDRDADAILANDPATLRSDIARCCQLKADVVSADEREETGLRAVLNFGHTVGHAIEAVAGYGGGFQHGEAVAVGMVAESRLAESLGWVGPEVTSRIETLLGRFGLPTTASGLDPTALIEAMGRDKKNQGGQIRFVLPRAIGRVELAEAPEAMIRAALGGDDRMTSDLAPIEANEEMLDLLRLTLVSGVGPKTCRSLLEQFGSAGKVLDVGESALKQVDGVGPKVAEKIARARREVDAEGELAACRRVGVRIIAGGSNGYPAMLTEIPDPPSLIYVRGTLEPADELAIALVGSRKCTPYGLRIAERLASSLARVGITVISGLARGIDAAAHRGALAAGGRTIAVLANGLGEVYPPEHEDLARQVADAGALISESALKQLPIAGLFPQRNRIISGMSLGVVVVEATPRSGSLSTAKHAMEQNRQVYAVPGPVDSLPSRGCHHLIRDGARLVESVDDILEELGPLVREVKTRPEEPAIRHPAELSLSDQERTLLGKLDDRGVAIDDLITATGLTPSQVMATLSVLEMRRLVRRLPGPRFARA